MIDVMILNYFFFACTHPLTYVKWKISINKRRRNREKFIGFYKSQYIKLSISFSNIQQEKICLFLLLSSSQNEKRKYIAFSSWNCAKKLKNQNIITHLWHRPEQNGTRNNCWMLGYMKYLHYLFSFGLMDGRGMPLET